MMERYYFTWRKHNAIYDNTGIEFGFVLANGESEAKAAAVLYMIFETGDNSYTIEDIVELIELPEDAFRSINEIKNMINNRLDHFIEEIIEQEKMKGK